MGILDKFLKNTKAAGVNPTRYLQPLTNLRPESGDSAFKSQKELFVDAYGSTGVVYSVISKISRKAKSLPYSFMTPRVNAVERPQEMQRLNELTSSCSHFWERIYISYLVAGEAFVCAIPWMDTDTVDKLIVPRPFDVTILENSQGQPQSYSVISENRTYTLDKSNVLHIKSPNMVELDHDRGFSPLQALRNEWQASRAISRNDYYVHDRHGANALIYDDEGGKPIAPKEREKKQEEYDAVINNSQRVGRLAYLGRKVGVHQLGMKPKDMDSASAKLMLMREICAAYDVPSMIMGDVAGSTYNNMKQAKRDFVADAVLPLVKMVLEELSPFLQEKMGVTSVLKVHEDQIPEMGDINTELSQKTIAELQAGIITEAEAREILQPQLGPLPNITENNEEDE